MADSGMGRIFLFALAIFGIGAAMSGPRSADVTSAPVGAPSASAPTAAPTVAYRPGEPMLSVGATELKRADNGHFNASVAVNGQAVEMVVDTGATAVALSVDDARRLGLAFDPAAFQVVGTGASGPVRGQALVLDDVAVDGRHVGRVEAVVLEGLDRSLLGQSYLRRLEQVRIDGDTMTLR